MQGYSAILRTLKQIGSERVKYIAEVGNYSTMLGTRELNLLIPLFFCPVPEDIRIAKINLWLKQARKRHPLLPTKQAV